jgi:hypothetical protein
LSFHVAGWDCSFLKLRNLWLKYGNKALIIFIYFSGGRGGLFPRVKYLSCSSNLQTNAFCFPAIFFYILRERKLSFRFQGRNSSSSTHPIKCLTWLRRYLLVKFFEWLSFERNYASKTVDLVGILDWTSYQLGLCTRAILATIMLKQ